MKISAAQKRVLTEIGTPGGEPLPPANIVRSLIRRGLVEAYDDPDDLAAKLSGAWSLRLTDAGKKMIGAP